MRRLFWVVLFLLILMLFGMVNLVIAIAPQIPNSQIILYTTFEQNFVFHVLDPYRKQSFEIARDLDFAFLYSASQDGENIFVRGTREVNGISTIQVGTLNLETEEFYGTGSNAFFDMAMWTADERIVAVRSRHDVLYFNPLNGEEEYLFSADINDAPVAAPNGCCIAYTTFNGIYIFEIATGNIFTIDETVDPNLNFFAPRFSPDSTQIAYIVMTSDNKNGIYVFDVTMGENRKITPDNTYNLESPTWSPDGKKIAFIRRIGQGDIYILDIKSRQD